jgi:hypothetical protein
MFQYSVKLFSINELIIWNKKGICFLERTRDKIYERKTLG